MHHLPFGELFGQHVPLAATFEQVQHRAKHFVQVHRWRLNSLACTLQQWPELFELLATDVTVMTSGLHKILDVTHSGLTSYAAHFIKIPL